MKHPWLGCGVLWMKLPERNERESIKRENGLLVTEEVIYYGERREEDNDKRGSNLLLAIVTTYYCRMLL